MKKYMLTISSMLIISSGMCSAATAEEVKKNFLETTDMFYAQPSDPTTVNAYRRAAEDITSFVEENSKNIIGSAKDTVLNNSAQQLETMLKKTIDLINTIRMNRNVNVDSDFAMLLKECDNVKKRLNKEIFIASEKKDAKNVLMYELETLNDMIKFAMEDYSKNVRRPITVR